MASTQQTQQTITQTRTVRQEQQQVAQTRALPQVSSTLVDERTLRSLSPPRIRQGGVAYQSSTNIHSLVPQYAYGAEYGLQRSLGYAGYQSRGLYYPYAQPAVQQVVIEKAHTGIDIRQIEQYYQSIIAEYYQRILNLELELKNAGQNAELLQKISILEQEILQYKSIAEQAQQLQRELEKSQKIIAELRAGQADANALREQLRLKTLEAEELARNRRLDEERIRNLENQLRGKNNEIAALNQRIFDLQRALEESELTITTIRNEQTNDIGIWKNKFIEANRNFYEVQEQLTLTQAELQDVKKRLHETHGSANVVTETHVRRSVQNILPGTVNNMIVTEKKTVY